MCVLLLTPSPCGDSASTCVPFHFQLSHRKLLITTSSSLLLRPSHSCNVGRGPEKLILSHFGGKTLHTHRIPGTPRQCSQSFTSIYSTTFLLITMGCFNGEQQKCEFSLHMEHNTAEWAVYLVGWLPCFICKHVVVWVNQLFTPAAELQADS